MQTLPASSFQSNMASCDLRGTWPSRQGCALTFQARVHVALMVLQGVVSLGMIFHHVKLLAGLSHPGSRPTWGKKMGCAQAKCWGEGRRGQGDRGAPPHFMEGRFLPLLSLLQQVEYPASSGISAQALSTCMCALFIDQHHISSYPKPPGGQVQGA